MFLNQDTLAVHILAEHMPKETNLSAGKGSFTPKTKSLETNFRPTPNCVPLMSIVPFKPILESGLSRDWVGSGLNFCVLVFGL